MSSKKNVYEVEIGDLPEYEKLVAFIYISDKSIASLMKRVESKGLNENEYHIDDVNSEEIAMISREEGIDKMKIRFSKYASKNDLDLDEFMNAIEKAKRALSK